jgi:bifunctional UDP-N-acetylglucosamine pyrophosphorylase/glucosamine-1-phosphate N-acetyltransferase
VEENDASRAERRVREINSGNFVFAPVDLFEALEEIRPDNEQKELYLTDVVSVLVRKGKKVTSVVANEPSEALGINSRKELALAEAALRERLSD